MKQLKVKLINILIRFKDFIDSIDNNKFVSGFSVVFVGIFFISIFMLDSDYSKREINAQDSFKLLEAYSLDTEHIDIPTEFYIESPVVPISIIDIKANGDLPSGIYAKIDETVQFNNLTDTDITLQSVQGDSLNLTIPQGTSASVAFYTSGILYYKVSDGRVGRIFIEE